MQRDKLLNFNFEKTEKGVFISNDFGNWMILEPSEFDLVKNGKFDKKPSLARKLKKKGFFSTHLDFGKAVSAVKDLNPPGENGPSLHIFVLTLKCNHRCVYCRALGADFKNTDMNEETARKCVDMALSSPNKNITIEFQGGESLINWRTLKKTVDYALRKNRSLGKNLEISVVTNFTLLDERKFEFLNKNRISVCTSLDGPREVHNRNRIYFGGSSYDITVNWLKRFADYSEKNRGRKDSLPSALMTTTKYSLDYPREIVDEYRALGLGGIFIRPLSPVGYAKQVFSRIGYRAEDFVFFYKRALDYCLKINSRGEKFIERTAAIILQKMLFGRDPNYLDLRSPCGAAIGQIAYNWNGDVYTCDEGRMVGARRDFSFRLGNVRDHSYADVVASAPSKLCVITSCLENQPECFRCAFKPFCGVCPVHNYEEQKTPWGNLRNSYWCGVQKGIFKVLTERLQDRKNRKIFESWFESTGGEGIAERRKSREKF